MLIGVGIGLYFSLHGEPPWWTGAAATLIVGAVVFGRRTRPLMFTVGLAVVLMGLGFSAAQWRTARVAAPVVAAKTAPTTVWGRVEMVEPMPSGVRVTLTPARITRIDPPAMPERVRLTLRGTQPDIWPGDWVRGLAVLLPPMAPAAPGAFEFQRHAYFQELGALGYALGSFEVTDRAAAEGLNIAIATWRQEIANRALGAAAGNTGGVIAALMTGRRGGISAAAMDWIRDAGLAHLLAISGLHLGLIATTLFFVVRAVLALIPALALRYDIKKAAAIVAIAGAAGYAVIAGATVPTQRALMMIAMVFGAILINRSALSMRTLAVAASVILLWHPESLLSASFQMSFAAVVALVAVFEKGTEGRGALVGFAWRRHPVLSYVAGTAAVTLIATIATAPFALYHFNKIAVYGMAANVVSVPVMAMWVMPWALAAFTLMPFGAESLALVPMTWGVDWILLVARSVAGWDGAVELFPAMPVWGLAAGALGGLWLCLWRQPWRYWGVAGMLLAAVSLPLNTPPDLLIGGDGKVTALRDDAGRVIFSSRRGGRLTRQNWLRRWGASDSGAWPAAGGGPMALGRESGRSLACDALGCILTTAHEIIALPAETPALAEDCRVATVLIAPMPVRLSCPAPKIRIDRDDLKAKGAHAFWFTDRGPIVRTVRDHRGDRPWVIGDDDGGI